MPGPEDITEDRGFKALFTSYPHETIATLVPELLERHGRPLAITPIQQEAPLPELAEPSRFLDLALHCRWADGFQTVILLIEHWSAARQVRLRRVLWYVADLALRHPEAQVLPLLLVTDPATGPVSGKLELGLHGIATVRMDARVIRITAEDLPRLRALQNRVAAVLMALAIHDAVEAACAALAALCASPGPPDDVRRFVPLAEKLARVTPFQRQFYRRRVQQETPMAASMFEEFLIEMAEERAVKMAEERLPKMVEERAVKMVEERAVKMAEERAVKMAAPLAEKLAAQAASAMAAAMAAQARSEEAARILATIRSLVARGVLSSAVARIQISELAAADALPRDLADQALAQLN